MVRVSEMLLQRLFHSISGIFESSRFWQPPSSYLLRGCIVAIASIVPVVAIFSCGGIEQMSPTGIAVWSDDCSEIACAVNKADFDGRLFMNHPTNEKYDLVIFDDKGKRLRTVVTDRAIDGYASQVEDIYYMKKKGYLLVSTLMLNCGGRRFEMITTDGKIKQLYHLPCENFTEDVKMIPSPNGAFIANAHVYKAAPPYRCQVTFYDETGMTVISITPEFETCVFPAIRWQSDSIFEVRDIPSSGIIKVMGPATAVRDSSGSYCKNPATSSSAYCAAKGYISFLGSSQSISFAPVIPTYMEWCGN